MNKRKETLLKILIASSIYTAILGVATFLHKDNNFNEDKFKCDKKTKVVKLVKKDGYSIFMENVRQNGIKRNAERKAKIEKQKQIELKRVLLEKKKAKEKAEKVKEEKRIAKKKKASQESKSISPSRGGNYDSNYNTTFNCTWYTSQNGSTMSSGKQLFAGACASNSLPEGTVIDLKGYGRLVVEDCGGSDLNSGNRLDIYLPKNQGESDSEYTNRTLELGRQQIRGYIVK